MPDKWDLHDIIQRMKKGATFKDATETHFFLKGIGMLLTFVLIIFFVFGMIIEFVDDVKKENCIHENYNKEVVNYNFDESRIETECDFCGKKMYFEGTVTANVFLEATCTETGLRTEYWTVQGHEELNTNFTRTVPLKEHNYRIISERVEPSCGGVGYSEEKVCIDCGYLFEKYELSNEGMKHDNLFIAQIDPTCTSVGYNGYYECQICGFIDRDIREIPMTEHDYEKIVIDVTYSTTGYTYYKCNDCDYEYIDEESYKEPLVNAYINYRIINGVFNFNNGDDYIVVEGPKEGVTEVVIPEEIDGIKVLKIEGPLDYEYNVTGKYFSSNENITKVVLPDTLHTIEQYAFYNCVNLKEINIPTNLREIGQSAFYNCKSLEGELVIPGSVWEINASTFSNCTSIKNLVISEGVSRILGNAFNGCSNLLSVILPNSLADIYNSAFSNCNKILIVRDVNNLYRYWPQSVIYRTDSTVDIGFVEYDDCLFVYDSNKEKYLLIECNKDGTEIILPDDVNSVGYEIVKGGLSYLSDNNIKSLTLKTINGNTFKDLFNDGVPQTLETIIIDTSDTVKENYFSNISSFKKVVFTEKTVNTRYSFKGCNNVEEFIIYKKLGGTLSGLFGDGSYYGNKVPTTLKTVEIYDMEVMNKDFFLDCSGLTKVVLPDNLKEIKEGAFKNCSSLKTLIIPSSVEKIENYTFDNCTNLIEIYNLSNLNLNVDDLNTYNKNLNVKVIYKSLEETSQIIELDNFVFLGVSNSYSLVEYKGNDKDIILPNDVNGFGYSIDKDVFSLNKTIESIVIPEKVISIAAGAFKNCLNLITVTVNANISKIYNETFYYCSSLTSVSYNNNVTLVGEKAFYCCSKLEQLNIGDNIDEIGPYAFYQCKKLTSIGVSETIEIINQYAFYQCIKLTSFDFTNNIKEIADYAFYECSSLTEICLPDSLELIGEYSFSKCSNLVDLTFNTGLKEIESRAFEECSKLNKLIFKEGLQRIYAYAFNKCNQVTEIYIPETVVQVRDKAFYNLSNVKKLTTPVCTEYICAMFVGSGNLYNSSQIDEITIIGNKEIPTEYLSYNRYTKKVILDDRITSIAELAISYMDSLEEVIMPLNIESIGSRNFTSVKNDCNIVLNSTNYKSIENNAAIIDLRTNTLICANEDTIIPSEVKVLADYLFYNSLMTEYIVPEGVEKIGNNTFRGCKNLEKLILPTTLKEIGDKCFFDANKLKSIIVSENIEKIGNNVFSSTGNKIYYLGSEDDFKNVIFDENNNLSLYTKIYYYSPNQPSNSGLYWCYDGENVKEW